MTDDLRRKVRVAFWLAHMYGAQADELIYACPDRAVVDAPGFDYDRWRLDNLEEAERLQAAGDRAYEFACRLAGVQPDSDEAGVMWRAALSQWDVRC